MANFHPLEFLHAVRELAEVQAAYEIAVQDLNKETRDRTDPIESRIIAPSENRVALLCISGISELTDTKIWLNNSQIVVFGHRSDITMAKMIIEMLDKVDNYVSLTKFCADLNECFHEVKVAQTATELMTRKRKLVEDALDNMLLHGQQVTLRSS